MKKITFNDKSISANIQADRLLTDNNINEIKDVVNSLADQFSKFNPGVTGNYLSSYMPTGSGDFTFNNSVIINQNNYIYGNKIYANNIDLFQKITNVQTDLQNNYWNSTTTSAEIKKALHLHTQVYNSLAEITKPEENILYLVKKDSDIKEEQNWYYQYIYFNKKFEKIGDTKIDLSNYYNKTEVNTISSSLSSAASSLVKSTSGILYNSDISGVSFDSSNILYLYKNNLIKQKALTAQVNLSNYYTKTEVNTISSSLSSATSSLVQFTSGILYNSDISGVSFDSSNILYLYKNNIAKQKALTAQVDLSNYYTKTEVNTISSSLSSAASSLVKSTSAILYNNDILSASFDSTNKRLSLHRNSKKDSQIVTAFIDIKSEGIGILSLEGKNAISAWVTGENLNTGNIQLKIKSTDKILQQDDEGLYNTLSACSGISLNGNTLSGQINSDGNQYLTVGTNGFKVSGVTEKIKQASSYVQLITGSFNNGELTLSSYSKTIEINGFQPSGSYLSSNNPSGTGTLTIDDINSKNIYLSGILPLADTENIQTINTVSLSHTKIAINQSYIDSLTGYVPTGNYFQVDIGINNVTSGVFAHTYGRACSAIYTYSYADGLSALAAGAISHAEGRQTSAFGRHSHAEGRETIASGQNSHAEGSHTIANGVASHAEGRETIANDTNSHSEGYKTVANGTDSHAEGYQSKSNSWGQHVEGIGIQPGYNYGSRNYNPYYTGNRFYVQHIEGRLNNQIYNSKYSIKDNYDGKYIGSYQKIIGGGIAFSGQPLTVINEIIEKHNYLIDQNVTSTNIDLTKQTADYIVRGNIFKLDWLGNAQYAGVVSAVHFYDTTLHKIISEGTTVSINGKNAIDAAYLNNAYTISLKLNSGNFLTQDTNGLKLNLTANNGVTFNGTQLIGKIDSTNNQYLTVSTNGFKVSGVTDKIKEASAYVHKYDITGGSYSNGKLTLSSDIKNIEIDGFDSKSDEIEWTEVSSPSEISFTGKTKNQCYFYLELDDTDIQLSDIDFTTLSANWNVVIDIYKSSEDQQSPAVKYNGNTIIGATATAGHYWVGFTKLKIGSSINSVKMVGDPIYLT